MYHSSCRRRLPAAFRMLAPSCLLLATAGGCIFGRGTPRPVYDVTLHNATPEPVSGATIRFADYDLADVVGGDLRPGERATHRDVEEPVPDRVHVLWTDA